ncbi:MAG: hypothetical protein L0H55_07060 [Candidatus Nitrosocosmicus sp.]|nr:hypothetical protein [Candidatus Nitrosocosmicus sp.]
MTLLYLSSDTHICIFVICATDHLAENGITRYVVRKQPGATSHLGLSNQELESVAPRKDPIKTIPKPDSKEQIVQRRYIDLNEHMEKLDKFILITPQSRKNKMLSASLVIALSSKDPVEELEELTNSAYANYCKVKLIEYIAKGNGMRFPAARIILEKLITNN